MKAPCTWRAGITASPNVRSRVAQASWITTQEKPEVHRGPGGGVDAHVAHGPANDQLRHPGRGQPLLQAGLPEAVGEVFFNDGLPRERGDASMDCHSRGVGQKEGRAFPQRDMLNVIGGPLAPAELDSKAWAWAAASIIPTNSILPPGK